MGRERNTHAQVPLAPKIPCGGRTTLSRMYVHMNTNFLIKLLNNINSLAGEVTTPVFSIGET